MLIAPVHKGCCNSFAYRIECPEKSSYSPEMRRLHRKGTRATDVYQERQTVVMKNIFLLDMIQEEVSGLEVSGLRSAKL